MALSKVNPRIWTTAKGGLIQCVSLTQDRIEDALDMMRDHFFKQENLCIALDVHKHPEAISELEDFSRSMMSHGISLIAVEEATGKIAGCVINKLIAKGDDLKGQFLKLHCKHPNAKAMMQALIEIDEEVDLFALLRTECVMEILFGAVRSEYKQEGVAKSLVEASMKVAQKLKDGENVKTSVDGQALPLGPRPTDVVTAPTAVGTRKIFEHLGFKTAAKINFHEKKKLEGLFSSMLPPSPIVYKSLK